MKLGELKKSLAKFPPDMDDMELLVQTGYDGVQQYDCLAFLATIQDEKFSNCLVLGTLEAVRILVKQKKLKVPDDYVPGGENDNGTSN